MLYLDSSDLQKCITSKTKLDGQVIENKNVKEVRRNGLGIHNYDLTVGIGPP